MIRSFVWGLCLAILLLGARTASAAAPICDETATSRIAPPPVLPIRDVKLEAGHPCEKAPVSEAPVAVAPTGPRAPVVPALSSDAVASEAWVRPIDAKIPPSASSRSTVPQETFARGKPGFAHGVFRPPR
jgi:hypothetical protein